MLSFILLPFAERVLAFVEVRELKDFAADFFGAADFLVLETVVRVFELALEAAFLPAKTFDFDFDVPNADEADFDADLVVRFAALATFGLRAVFVAMFFISSGFKTLSLSFPSMA